MQVHGESASGEPEVSVIVPTRNRSSILRGTLQHLLASPPPRPWEVVVVANACTDDTSTVVAEVAAAGAAPLRVVEEPRPGAAIARNRGASVASGQLLVFVDDDILVEPDALETILAWYDDHDRRSLLVGQVLPMAEHLATPFGAFRQRALGDVPRSRPPHEVDWYASGVAAVPAEAFALLGGYAESYPAAGLEDIDLAIRARRAGHRIVFHPAVVGFHNDWAGTTARDYCRRNALYSAQGPLLAERFPDEDHSWARVIEVNRPAVAGDPLGTRARKGLKLAAVKVGGDRWLPAVADRLPLPQRPRETLFRASVSLAMFAGYQRGLQQRVEARDVLGEAELTPSTDGTELSIVIVTFNCGDEVERALDSVRRHPPSVSHEIVVIDNASQDDTEARLGARFPDVKVIPLDDNIGYGSAVNLAVKETQGRYLLLLNPDTETTAGAIDTLLRAAKADDRVGVVGPRLVLGTGRPQASARRFPSPWRLWFEVLRLHLLLPRSLRSRLLGGTYSAQDEPGRVDWVSGACHLIPRAVWERVGSLTERTFCGFDDLDYCWRARKAGFDTLFCPDALIVHHCSVAVARRWTPQEIDALAINNIYVLLEDHWSRRRVKLYCAAEWAGTLSDVLLGDRRARLSRRGDGSYRQAARKRLRLLTVLLLDRIRPIERHEPGVPQAGRAIEAHQASAIPSQPVLHRIAWHLAESGLRGKSRVGSVLRWRTPAPTGLVRLPNGHVLHHDPSDYVAHNIYLGGYEPAERWVFRQLVRPNAVVVDVGANLGIYTLTASELVGAGGRVLAIEPGPALPGLRVAVEAAGCTNVTIIPLAVGAEPGEAVMHVPGHHAGLASLRASCDQSDARVVGVTRLDALDHLESVEIDLLKIDTEGYEGEVLAGAEALLKARRIRAILLEVSPEFGDISFLGATAIRYDFAIFKIGYRKGLRYRPVVWPVSIAEVEGEPTQANYLLLRSDLTQEPALAAFRQTRSL